jgi:hypothetical protein
LGSQGLCEKDSGFLGQELGIGDMGLGVRVSGVGFRV